MLIYIFYFLDFFLFVKILILPVFSTHIRLTYNYQKNVFFDFYKIAKAQKNIFFKKNTTNFLTTNYL